MDSLTRRHWLVTALLFGIVYVAVGLISSALSGAAGSRQLSFAWRLGAYVVSAIAFAIHVRHEYFTARGSPATTALHAATGVALGAFFLAAAALLHAQVVGGPNPVGHVIALVAWPAITAIPAFIVALAATAVLARTQPRD